jgi:predicted cobalt transporter CbtA
MLRTLLICGLVAGALAAVLATGFATVAGEPAVDGAIAFEDAQARAAHEAPATEVVSRTVQKTVGLFTAAAAYCVALGGLFALVFAVVYGRVAVAPPGRTARWLALAAFVVVFLVPFLKYPASPPGATDPETIGTRTLAYATMVAISLLAATAALRVRRSRGNLAAAVLFVVVAGAAGLALPAFHEVPGDFPASTLWSFRAASIGTQAVIWLTIGLMFGPLAQRTMRHAR